MIFVLFFGIIRVMIITYFGKQFFKIARGEMVLAFNPVNKASQSGISTHFGADIALVTANYPDYNGTEQLSHGERTPLVVRGPGDYEIKEIFIKGMMLNTEISKKNYINTVYFLSVDNINIAFLGVLSSGDLPKDVREIIDSPDILFVPVSGAGSINPKESAKLASSLEPRMIIPMDYDDMSLRIFLKEIGEEKAEVVDKLTLKRKDLEGKEGKVVVLKAV